MTLVIYTTLALLLQNAKGLSPNYSTDRVRASQEVRSGLPPSTLEEMSTAPNVDRLMRVFPKEKWTELFPHANKDGGPEGTPYNYLNLVSAAWKFPRFCGEDGQTDAECLHEVVVMFSHFIQETGGKRGPSEGLEDGLYWQREIDCYNPSNPHGVGSCNKEYCSENGVWSVYPCGDRAYYGRGAKQLSWNYNYAAFSKKMTGSANTYLLEPDRVITDGWPALASAIWFWMTPQLPKPSMHEVVTGLWTPNAADATANIILGFGTTTNIINGAIECGKGAETAQSLSRMGYYRNLCGRLGAECFSTPDTCGSMQTFPAAGAAGSGPLYYLDRRWDGVQGCKAVTYQMPFLVDLDEQSCKCHYFPNNADCTNAEADTPPADCSGVALEWGQCGGEGAASLCCEAGTQCFRNSKWYSQCRISCPAGWECDVGARRLRGAAQ